MRSMGHNQTLTFECSRNSLSTLVPHLSPARIQTTIDRLVALTSDPDDGVRDIASLGLKMVVGEVQPGTALAQTCCQRLAPEIVKLLSDVSRRY